MNLSGNDQDRQAAETPLHRGKPPAAPADGGHWRKSRAEAALATAQRMANSAEQILLLCTAVSATETNTALATVKAARAVLHMAQIALRSLEKNQR